MFVPSPDTTGFGALLRATGATHRFEAARFPCRTMSNEDEPVQGLAGERRDGEEVGGPQVVSVVAPERPPSAMTSRCRCLCPTGCVQDEDACDCPGLL